MRHRNALLQSLLKFDSVNSTCGGGFSFYGYWKIRSVVKIFNGTSNLPLANAIAASIGLELGKCTVSAFPDGETFVKIEENVRGEDVFLVQSTSPPTNHNLMEMFIMMDALRRASASRITAVLPFYGYARQDRKEARDKSGGHPGHRQSVVKSPPKGIRTKPWRNCCLHGFVFDSRSSRRGPVGDALEPDPRIQNRCSEKLDDSPTGIEPISPP